MAFRGIQGAIYWDARKEEVMFEGSIYSRIKGGAVGKMNQEISLEKDLESFPFAGLPFSYEGRFSALFEEEWEKNSNKTVNRRDRGREIDKISDDSFRGLFPLPLIARYKFVPFVSVLVVALLGTFTLVKIAFY